MLQNNDIRKSVEKYLGYELEVAHNAVEEVIVGVTNPNDPNADTYTYERKVRLCWYGGFTVNMLGTGSFDDERWHRKLAEYMGRLIDCEIMDKRALACLSMDLVSLDKERNCNVNVKDDRSFELSMIAYNPTFEMIQKKYKDAGFDLDNLKFTEEQMKKVQRRRMYLAYFFPTLKTMDRYNELTKTISPTKAQNALSCWNEKLFNSEGELPGLELEQDSSIVLSNFNLI